MTRTVHTRILDALATDRFVPESTVRRRTGLTSQIILPAVQVLTRLRLVDTCLISAGGRARRIYRRVEPLHGPALGQKPASRPRTEAA